MLPLWLCCHLLKQKKLTNVGPVASSPSTPVCSAISGWQQRGDRRPAHSFSFYQSLGICCWPCSLSFGVDSVGWLFASHNISHAHQINIMEIHFAGYWEKFQDNLGTCSWYSGSVFWGACIPYRRAWFSFQLLCFWSSFLLMCTVKSSSSSKQVVAQVLGSLPPVWKLQFWASDFSLDETCPLQAFVM